MEPKKTVALNLQASGYEEVENSLGWRLRSWQEIELNQVGESAKARSNLKTPSLYEVLGNTMPETLAIGELDSSVTVSLRQPPVINQTSELLPEVLQAFDYPVKLA